MFYLAVVAEAPEPSKLDPVGALGVDLGVVNLATDSDGEDHTGKKVDTVRGKMSKLRSSLQKKDTRSAKRHLKRLSGRESRFVRNVNHCISKRIVAKAKDSHRAIGLEDLRHIRSRGKRFRKAQRSCQSSWSFGQLRAFIEYKSALAGVPVVFV
ncbi:MAG: transposase, partial [Patescibacteria group bacterium]